MLKRCMRDDFTRISGKVLLWRDSKNCLGASVHIAHQGSHFKSFRSSPHNTIWHPQWLLKVWPLTTQDTAKMLKALRIRGPLRYIL